jgi:acetate kinase
MKILVANLGSTSFKYRLFDMDGEKLLARGGVERIGSANARCFVQTVADRDESVRPVADHAAAVRMCLGQLSDPRRGCLKNASDLNAIGFKAVLAKGYPGTHRVTDGVLDAMEEYGDVAPAHNPPYVKAMRLLAREFPELPLVAAFETEFHETVTPAHKLYAVPYEWVEQYGVKRWGFHGASHRYIAERTLSLLGKPDAKVISCHLGGSSSLCATRGGKSVASSLGMSPQTGLPHNNRVGEFDVFALPALIRATGKSLEQLLDDLANRSGLEGLSGAGNDLRDIESAAEAGNERAKLAMDVFVASIRQYLGSYLLLLNGADAIVFTGGIGENSSAIREAVCENLDWFGIALDCEQNRTARGEATVHAAHSRVQLWIMPTNEELVVARRAAALLAKG